MANSRKSHSLNNPAVAEAVSAFERALEAILARVAVSADTGIALAYSGGLDSSVLLALTSAYCSARGMPLTAFHIHHGLSPNADSWLAHCEKTAHAAGVRFVAQRVVLSDIDAHGVEQAARIARYQALAALCRTHGLPLLLTAHHQDDQAETVLLQLLRGAGLPGLSGMAALQENHALLDEGVALGRPLLGLTRQQLELLAQLMQCQFIVDESNTDTRYRRNAVRQQIAPAIEEHFPGFAAQIARSSSHVQSAQRLLDELAAIDLQLCQPEQVSEPALDLGLLSGLSPDRIDNLLRYWLRQQGLRLPSSAQLAQLRGQMLGAGSDADPMLEMAGVRLQRRAGRLVLAKPSRMACPPDQPLFLNWQGEAELLVPQWQGKLVFENVSGAGLDRERLLHGPLILCARQGSERLKLEHKRPSRSLKNLFQDMAVPAAERPWQPLLYIGQELAFVGALGSDIRLQKATGGVQLRWESRF